MSTIISGEDVIIYLSNENTLLDSKLDSLRVYENQGVSIIELKFIGRSSSEYESCILKFSLVESFDFCYLKNYPFFYIEDLKFFKTPDDMFYISLQPDENINIESLDDQNYIKAKNIELYI